MRVIQSRFATFIVLLTICYACGNAHAHAQRDLPLSAADMERQFFVMVNQERADQGLHPLIWDAGLHVIAASHCQKMAAENRLDHHFPDYPAIDERLWNHGMLFKICGENIARGEATMLQQIHQAFLHSQGHRNNILSAEFFHCAIAVVRAGSEIFVTQEFAHLVLHRRLTRIEPERSLLKLLGRIHGTANLKVDHALSVMIAKATATFAYYQTGEAASTLADAGAGIFCYQTEDLHAVPDDIAFYLARASAAGKFGLAIYAIDQARDSTGYYLIFIACRS